MGLSDGVHFTILLSLCSAQYCTARRVTDRRTDGHVAVTKTALAYIARVKTEYGNDVCRYQYTCMYVINWKCGQVEFVHVAAVNQFLIQLEQNCCLSLLDKKILFDRILSEKYSFTRNNLPQLFLCFFLLYYNYRMMIGHARGGKCKKAMLHACGDVNPRVVLSE